MNIRILKARIENLLFSRFYCMTGIQHSPTNADVENLYNNHHKYLDVDCRYCGTPIRIIDGLEQIGKKTEVHIKKLIIVSLKELT